MFGSQNLLTGHIFCHCSASKTTNTQHILSILLFSLKVLLQKWSYYSKNMNLVSTHAEERDLEIKTEMNASNYTEFQVLQQVLGTWTPPPFGNTITQGTEVFPTHLCNITAMEKASCCYVHNRNKQIAKNYGEEKYQIYSTISTIPNIFWSFIRIYYFERFFDLCQIKKQNIKPVRNSFRNSFTVEWKIFPIYLCGSRR